jgi:pyruvate dehydrogenase E2 component (dihydrolipoamide acetyltransferase)
MFRARDDRDHRSGVDSTLVASRIDDIGSRRHRVTTPSGHDAIGSRRHPVTTPQSRTVAERGGRNLLTVRIEMPQLSAEGEIAALATWLVKAGDAVEAGDVIAELETDKSTVELEAPESGTVAEIVVAAGTEGIEAGALLALLDPAPGATASDAKPSSAPQASETSDISATPRSSEASDPPATPAPPPVVRSEDDRMASTPLARRAAANLGVELEAIEGSGSGGRILAADVLRGSERVGGAKAGTKAIETSSRASTAAATRRAAAGIEQAAGSGVRVERLSAMRKTIARRMTESKQQVPHFYLSAVCDMDVLLDVRARLNAELETANQDTRISVNDFILRATALALREVRAANVSFVGDAIHFFDRVDIAVAVATDGGLVTPVVRSADRKGLTVLAAEMRELAGRAREGKLRPEEYRDGTFTVSNLGMYGIDTVYPILNPPQACILGVGAAEERAVVRSGQVEAGRVATLTLAADHRAVDGAVGALLLAAIRARLEDPLTMML